MMWIAAEGNSGFREPLRLPAGVGATNLPGYRVETLEWTEALVLGSAGDFWPGSEGRA